MLHCTCSTFIYSNCGNGTWVWQAYISIHWNTQEVVASGSWGVRVATQKSCVTVNAECAVKLAAKGSRLIYEHAHNSLTWCHMQSVSSSRWAEDTHTHSHKQICTVACVSAFTDCPFSCKRICMYMLDACVCVCKPQWQFKWSLRCMVFWLQQRRPSPLWVNEDTLKECLRGKGQIIAHIKNIYTLKACFWPSIWNVGQNFTLLVIAVVVIIVWVFSRATAFAFVPNDFDVCNFIDLLSKRDRPKRIVFTWHVLYIVSAFVFVLSELNKLFYKCELIMLSVHKEAFGVWCFSYHWLLLLMFITVNLVWMV